MIGKIILAAALLTSGVAFAQQTLQPNSNVTPPESSNRLPLECWDTHTNRARPVTAADSKTISPGPATTDSAYGSAPATGADRRAGMPKCD